MTKSQTFIEGGKTFRLGGEQSMPFHVNIENKGFVGVQIQQVPTNGMITSLGYLQPNEARSFKVDAKTAVYMVNASNRRATLRLKILGGEGLGMRYTETLGMSYKDE